MLTSTTGVGVQESGGVRHAQLFPGFRPARQINTRVLTWLAFPGSAVAVEAILRDGLCGPPVLTQYEAACIALAIIWAPLEASHNAIPARISLAATLRKLMHPASAQLWASAVNPCPIWCRADMCSRREREDCQAVISALFSKIDYVVTDLPISQAACGSAPTDCWKGITCEGVQFEHLNWLVFC